MYPFERAERGLNSHDQTSKLEYSTSRYTKKEGLFLVPRYPLIYYHANDFMERCLLRNSIKWRFPAIGECHYVTRRKHIIVAPIDLYYFEKRVFSSIDPSRCTFGKIRKIFKGLFKERMSYETTLFPCLLADNYRLLCCPLLRGTSMNSRARRRREIFERVVAGLSKHTRGPQQKHRWHL